MTKDIKATLLIFATTLVVDLYGPATPFWWTENPPEYTAAIDGNLEVVKKYVQEGGDINKRYCIYGRPSLLFLALNYQQWHLAHYLLNSGANPRGKYDFSYSCPIGLLVICAEKGCPKEIIKKLIEADAEN